MKLYPESKKIHELFPISGNIEYHIPIYQRSYSWKNENIETLFNDIDNENEGYYIGNLLITPHFNDYNSQGIVRDAFDIVDGQQRLTTIALFHLAIFEILSEKINLIEDKNIEIYEDCISIKRDIKRQLIKKDNTPRLHILEDDQKIFNDLLEVLEGNSDYKQHRNRIFGKRYSFIKDVFYDEFFNKESKTKESGLTGLLGFYDKLKEVEILKIEVSDLTDAFSIFTSFNAKGLPLTLIDLLKSYYLRNAQVIFGPEKALNKWYKLIEIFYDKNDEPISMLVTQFLQNFYDTFESTGTSSITKSQALREYERLFAAKGANYIDILINVGQIFSSFTNKIDDNEFTKVYSDEIREKLMTLNQLESSSLYPILLFILRNLKDGKINKNSVTEVLDYCINYFVRRNIVLKPKSSNLRAKVLQSVRILEKSDDLNEEALQVIKDNLNSIAANDEEFKSSLRGDIYEISKTTTRIILSNIESSNGNYFNKQNRNNLNDRDNKGNYIWTLEHIMPQSENLSDSWKDFISEGVELTEEKILQRHRENVHKIGNLTLTGYNSEMSNKDFIEKLNYKDQKTAEYVGLKTPLFINESIFKNSTNNEDAKWTISDIENRTKYISGLVIKQYPIK